jgi:hypothetical protein
MKSHVKLYAVFLCNYFHKEKLNRILPEGLEGVKWGLGFAHFWPRK